MRCHIHALGDQNYEQCRVAAGRVQRARQVEMGFRPARGVTGTFGGRRLQGISLAILERHIPQYRDAVLKAITIQCVIMTSTFQYFNMNLH